MYEIPVTQEVPEEVAHFKAVNDELLRMIPREEYARVMDSDVDIDASFLGFVNTYKALSQIIPRGWTVIDLGCAYNPQSYFFTKHARYIAVDEPAPATRRVERFKPDNCTIYEMDLQEFAEKHRHEFDLHHTFAICNYVPCGDTKRAMLSQWFKNCYSFYP